jgi:hypothetical protein
MDKLNELRELLNGLEEDFNKFYGKGNNSAGPKIRKGMQNLKLVAQDVRVNVMDTIKERQAAKKENK